MKRFYGKEVYPSQSIVKFNGCADTDCLLRFYQLATLNLYFKK